MDQLDADIKNIEDKIPDITNLSTDTTLNAKIYEVKNEILSITNLATAALNVKVNEIKNKIPNITILATTTALTVVENKILTVNDLVKKTDYNTKISVIENKLLLMMIMINILLLKNFISSQRKLLLQD